MCISDRGAKEKSLAARDDRGLRLWRQSNSIYVGVVDCAGSTRSFQAVTKSALDFALAAHGVESGALRDRLLLAYERLDAFPEVAGALQALQQRGLRMAALSNGDPDMLENGLRAAGIRGALEAVLSVAPLRIFKPDRQVYERGRAWAAAQPDEIAFVSANAWDAGGAAAFGLRTFWINRAGQPDEYDITRRATTIRSLGDLAAGLI